MNDPIAVLVTTSFKGVFFGYTTDDIRSPSIYLTGCRMAVTWSADVRGIIGLAAAGPTKGCRISQGADGVVHSITAAWLCTPKATKAWEAAPWDK